MQVNTALMPNSDIIRKLSLHIKMQVNTAQNCEWLAD